jgi:hypothetical protein
LANSIASYKLLETAPHTTKHITDLQTLLQTHHFHPQQEEDMSALSDNSHFSFDSKTSKNRYEIDRRAAQVAQEQITQTVYQLKLQQGIILLQSGALSRELALKLELPYKDILKSQSTNTSSSEVQEADHDEGDDDQDMDDEDDKKPSAAAVVIHITQANEDAEMQDGHPSFLPLPDPESSPNDDDDGTNDDESADSTNDSDSDGSDDSHSSFPSSNMDESDNDSEDTPRRGSPHKLLATGSQNAGKPP